MDPNTAPVRSSEETTTNAGAGGRQVVSTKRSEGPTQVAEEISTSQLTPSGSTMRTERTAGLSPDAAKAYDRKKGIFRTYQVLWYILGLIEILLAFRFFFKLAGANPDSGFVNFIYGASNPFAGPFLETFRATPSQGAETTSYFEWSTLVAAAVYAIVCWGIMKIFKLAKPADPEEVERTIAAN
jgi:hypothetical protein